MSNPKSTASISGHPLHAALVPFPIAFYFGTFLADLLYGGTDNDFWAEMAFWLLVAGFTMSLLASLMGFIDFVGEPKIRALQVAWMHFIGNATIGLISAVDLYLRYLAGPEAGSRNYLWMSGLVVLILLFTGWLGGQLVYRHRVGIAD
jgi:uncharacterized membrane protein